MILFRWIDDDIFCSQLVITTLWITIMITKTTMMMLIIFLWIFEMEGVYKRNAIYNILKILWSDLVSLNSYTCAGNLFSERNVHKISYKECMAVASQWILLSLEFTRHHWEWARCACQTKVKRMQRKTQSKRKKCSKQPILTINGWPLGSIHELH